jgi:hypothetical protein
LLFFGEQQENNPSQRYASITHVAISLGDDEILHANGPAWSISYNSLNSSSPLFRGWLRDNLVGIRVCVKLITEPYTIHLRTTFRIAHSASDQRHNVIVRLGKGDEMPYTGMGKRRRWRITRITSRHLAYLADLAPKRWDIFRSRMLNGLRLVLRRRAMISPSMIYGAKSWTSRFTACWGFPEKRR